MWSADLAAAIVVSVAIVCFTAYNMLVLYLNSAYEKDDEDQ